MESYRIEPKQKSALTFSFARWWLYIAIILVLSLGKNLLF